MVLIAVDGLWPKRGNSDRILAVRHKVVGSGDGVRCSVVILTYGRDGILQEVLQGLRENLVGRTDYEIILVDNNADEIDRSSFLNQFSSAQYLRTGENKGVSARNDGMDVSRGDFIVLLDDDVFIQTPAFIDIFSGVFDCDARVGLINPRKVIAGTMEMFDQFIPHTNKNIDTSKPFYTFRFSGGCIALRTSLYRELGGYSAEFIYSGEEIEYGYRVIDAGWKIFYTPEVVAIEHEHPGGRQDLISLETKRLTYKLMSSYLRMPFPQVAANLIVYPLYHYRARKGGVRVLPAIVGFCKWLLRRSRPRRKPIGSAAQRYIRECGGAIWR